MTNGYQVRFLQIPRWLAALAGLAAIAFAVALFLLSLTVFLVLLPVVAVASGLYYLFGRRRVGQPRHEGRAEIIDGEYRVIDPERIDRSREPRS